ncbi:MAG: hypothetical protein RL172_1862 [Bacteroidota bacterium]|jgi:hypothetical protein
MSRSVVVATTILISIIGRVVAQPAGFPVPAIPANHLFYLQRTPNHNTIMCDLNLVNGKLDEADPVHVYWIRYTEQGQKQELNYIQRKFAYGIKSRKLDAGKYELSFVSYKKFKIILMQGKEGRYRGYAIINNRTCVLNKIYLHINGGTFWSPNVEYVEVTGQDVANGQQQKERKKI